MREFRRILSLLIITLLLFAFISPPVSSAYELVPIPAPEATATLPTGASRSR